MESSQSQTLKGLVRQIIEWAEQPPIEEWKKRSKGKGRRKRIYRAEIPCSLLHLKTLHKFLSIPGVDSKIIAARISQNLLHTEVWYCRFKPHKFKKVSRLVASLLLDLKEAFRVPKLQRPDENGTLKRRGIIAGFVELLSKLLINKEDISATGFDQVMKELRYFVNIFWDKPFQATEHVLVQSLLAQFEGLLNEAGRFVYSLVFLSDHLVDNRIDEALLEPISFLKNNIVVFLSTMPDLVTSMAFNYRDVDSLFIVESLVYDLKGLLSRSDAQIVEMKDQIQMLHSTLMFSWSLLKEHLEVEESKEIRIEIRGLAYEAECLINSFLVGHVPAWYLTINLSIIIYRVDLIGTKIEEMRHSCNVEVLKAEISSDAQLSQDLGIGIEVDGTVVGIEQEEMRILDQLVGGTKNLQFISIVGTPGLGKTTLAKKLFNNFSVGHLFDRRSWCVVSQMYTRKKVLSDIFNCLEDDAQLKADEQDAVLQIYQALYGRRYLIVLDDMWDSDVWDDLQSCFPDNKNGSRILFTSRNRDAAPVGSIICALPLWSNNQCWELLEKKVFVNETCRPELQGVGKKIAANCKGLPLVVVVVASILSMIDKVPSAWKVVAQDIGSHIFSDQNTWVMQILKLSYKHLPKYLKPCFLCFGVFRRGTEIPVKKLVQLWIAEGFIHSENKRAEDRAEDFFLELVDKSLVTISKKRSDGGAKACVIHDLLHDMCSKVAEEENFLKNTCDGYPIRVKVLVVSSQFLQPYGPWLRSFYRHRSYELLSVMDMKLLRVLDCWPRDPHVFFLQKTYVHLVGLEHLVNLRYLATRLVPEHINSLVSLEYLILDESVYISSFILKLVKLRYIKPLKCFSTTIAFCPKRIP